MEKESLLSIIKEAIEDYPSLVSLLTGTKEHAEEENAAITFERLCSEGFIYFENDHEEPFSAENKCCLYVACDNETLRITILCPHDKWIIDGITQRPIEIASLLFKGIHGKKSIQSGTLYFWNGDSNPINDEIGSFWVLFGTQDYLDKSRSNPFTEHNLIAAEVLKRFVNDETISTLFALQGNRTERIKKLCDDGILSLSQYPGIKNRIKIIFSIECPDYIVSWDVLGQHEEDLLWTVSDTIENIMHSFPGAKVLRRGELISLTDDIQSCSSAFNFSYSAESLYETVSEKDRIRIKPNFFCDIDVMNVLINREISENVPEMDFTVSLIELPLWLSFSHDDNNWIFKVYSQHEMFNRDESLASEKGHLVVDKETGEGSGSGREELKDAITLFFKACQSLSIFIREEGIEKQFPRLDPDKSGILLSVRDGKIVYKVVSGKERPDLTCETLTGEVVQGRPYSEDFWERSYYDLKSWDDLIELANEGDIQAMDKVAMAYLNGGDVIHEEVEPDPEKAVLWFEKMADAGSSNGMFNLGLHYAKGYGVKRDFKKAAEWMKRALLAGDQDAERLVGEYSRLAECLRLAEEGDAEAQADLAAGYMSLGGSLEQAGVGEDYKESVKWAQLAADQGNGDGLWTLALAYEHGRGVEKDIEKAVRYYEQGAELGHSKCQHSLGCYCRLSEF